MGILWQKRWRATSRLRQAVGRALAPEAVVPPVPFEVAVERRRVEVVEEAHGDDAAIKMALELEVAIDLAVAGFGKVAPLVVLGSYAERVAAILVRVVEALAVPFPAH